MDKSAQKNAKNTIAQHCGIAICEYTAALQRLARLAWLFMGILFCCTCLTARAQFLYTTNDGTITITGYTGPGGVVVIPSAIGGISVTRIGASAFFRCTNVLCITLPDSIETIELRAFEYCTNLHSVSFGTGLLQIGQEALYGCPKLTNATIPDSTTSIADGAFAFCSSLTSVDVPKNVTNIGYYAFGNCTNLSAITVDELNAKFSSKDGVLFNKGKTTLIQFPPWIVGQLHHSKSSG